MLFGLLAVAAIPVCILITNYRNDLRLIHAGYSVPVAAVLGLKESSTDHDLTLYLALIGAIALAFYYVDYHVLS